MRAQELANDLAHQLELVESERDDLKLRLDEAEAVIDAVRKVRDQWRTAASTFLWPGGIFEQAVRKMLRTLDEVDGL